MNLSIPSPLKAVGLLAFFATGIVGWQLAEPSAPATKGETTILSVTKRAARPPRPSNSGAADAAAGKRMGSIRAFFDPETRMLATISLAESLSPPEFAAWMDRGWFDLRGGPELMIFSKILMDRWHQEDPEGLMGWAVKNKNGAADGLMDDWAAHEPQRLIDYFKSNRDDGMEFEMLAKISAGSPEIALQELREMAENGIAPDAASHAQYVIQALAKNSPAALEAMLDSFDPAMKLRVEGALSKLRMAASFADELHNLQGRKDGWQIFSSILGSTEDIGSKLLGELSNLPPEWRSGMAMNPGRTVCPTNAQQWWDADLEGAGFSITQAKNLRIQALQHLASADPETNIARMDGLQLNPFQRSNILDGLFSLAKDPEKARDLIAGLQTQEERNAATRILGQRTAPRVEVEVKTPEDLFAKLATEEANSGTYFLQVKNWDSEQVAALSAGFKSLPAEQKQKFSQIIIANMQFTDPPANLRDEAVRYFAENSPTKDAKSEDGWKSPNATISQYVVNLSTNDPVAASQWVQSLPSSNTKTWVQWNLVNNWQQYDPKAASQWKKSLSADERASLDKLKGMPSR